MSEELVILLYDVLTVISCWSYMAPADNSVQNISVETFISTENEFL